jgi:L-lysine 2,3-aminomutase
MWYDFLFGNFRKTSYQLDNELLIDNLFKRIKTFDKNNRYQSRIVLQYLEKAFQEDESIEELHKVISLGKEKLEKVNEYEKLFSLQLSLLKNEYIHWGNKRKYVIDGIALPVLDNTLGKYIEAFHTEKEKFIKLYCKGDFFFHKYDDEVLVIYSGNGKLYARPYEMFFGTVVDEGIEKPRFQKILS